MLKIHVYIPFLRFVLYFNPICRMLHIVLIALPVDLKQVVDSLFGNIRDFKVNLMYTVGQKYTIEKMYND